MTSPVEASAPSRRARTSLRSAGFGGDEAGARRRPAMLALKLAVSAGLMIFILRGADLAAVGRAFARVEPGWLVAAFALQLVGAGLMTLRWRGLLAAQGVALNFGYLFRSTLVAAFFRQFLPSIIGGDALRGYDAWRAGARPGVAIMSLLVDRLLGIATLAIFALAAAALSTDVAARAPGIWLWVAAGLASAIVALGLLFAPKVGGLLDFDRLAARAPRAVAAKLSQLVSAFRIYGGDPWTLARAFGLSVLLQVNVVTFYWMLSEGLGLGIDYHSFYVIVPIAIFVMLAPITINGIGLREAIFIYLLGLWSVDQPQALAFAWIEYGLFLGFGLIGGLVYAARRG